MNPDIHDPNHAADETLRLIATLPVPAGLEDRVHATLRSAQSSIASRRPGRVLAWPSAQHAGSNWMRTAAAAAIAFVIAGGGWGVYSRVQPAQPGRVIAMPPRATPGSFTGAGAIRTPQTLNGPVIVHPAKPRTAQAKPARKPARSGASTQGQPVAQDSAVKPAASTTTKPAAPAPQQ